MQRPFWKRSDDEETRACTFSPRFGARACVRSKAMRRCNNRRRARSRDQPAWMDKASAPGTTSHYAKASGSRIRRSREDRSNIGGFYIADQEARRTRAPCRRILKATRRRTATMGDRQLLQGLSRHRRDRPRRIAPARGDLDAIARIADKAS